MREIKTTPSGVNPVQAQQQVFEQEQAIQNKRNEIIRSGEVTEENRKFLREHNKLGTAVEGVVNNSVTLGTAKSFLNAVTGNWKLDPVFLPHDNYAPDTREQIETLKKAGVDEEYFQEAMDASSPAEFEYNVQQATRKQEALNKMATLGVGGNVATAIAGGLIDLPLEMLVGDKGLSWITKAQQVSRLSKKVMGGVEAAAASGVMNTALAATSNTYDMDDAMFDTALAFGLGTAFTRGKLSQEEAKALTLSRQIQRSADVEQHLKGVNIDDVPTQADLDSFPEVYKKVGDSWKPKEREEIFEDIAKQHHDPMFSKQWRWLDQTNSGVLENSESEVVRNLRSILMPSSTGGAKGSVQAEDALSFKQRLVGRMTKQFQFSYNQQVKAYLKSQGKSTVGSSIFTRKAHEELDRLATREMRGIDTGNKFAKAIAAKTKELQDELFSAMKNPRMGESLENAVPVKGAGETEAVENYFHRKWVPESLTKKINEWSADRVYSKIAASMDLGEGSFLHADEALSKLSSRLELNTEETIGTLGKFSKEADFRKFLRDKGLSDVEIKEFINIYRQTKKLYGLAKGIVQIIRTSQRHEGVDIATIFAKRESMPDAQFKQYLMDEHGVDAGQAQRLVSDLRSRSKKGGEAQVKSLRGRVKLDETYEGMEDFFDNSITSVFLGQLNSTAGHISLARMGIDSESSFKALLKKVEDEVYSPENATARGTIDKRRKRELDILNKTYDHIIGRPTSEDAGSNWSTAMRLMRKYNFTRLMGQVGFSQISEMGILNAHLGSRVIFSELSELRSIMKRAASGDKVFLDELSEELSDYTGAGFTDLMHHMNLGEDKAFSTVAGKMEEKLDTAGRVTSVMSGMEPITNMQQLVAARGFAHRFAELAKGGRSFLNEARLRELGLDEEKLNAVLESIRKYSKFRPNGKLKALNMGKWDADTAAAFSNASHQFRRRTIQENSWSEEIAGVTDTAVGKLLLQFKRFMLGSYTRHLVHSMKHRDFIAFNSFMQAMMLSGLVYNVQTHLQAYGRKDRKDFLDKRLGKGWEHGITPEMAATAFQRSPQVAMLPGLADTISNTLWGSQYFNNRSSGLASDMITGAATVDLINKFYSTVQGVQPFNADRQFSEKDYDKATQLLLFQNNIVIHKALMQLKDALNLPEHSAVN